jgi:hypothetical protein
MYRATYAIVVKDRVYKGSYTMFAVDEHQAEAIAAKALLHEFGTVEGTINAHAV